MQVLRSLIFNITYYVITVSMTIATFLGLSLGRTHRQGTVRLYSRIMIELARLIAGIRYEVRGRENLPPGPCLIVSKHQSVWDTMAFYLLCDEPCYVMKKELMDMPIWGWAARRTGHIGVNRGGGATALKQLVRETQHALENGRQVIIFPEGTRMAPDAHRPYFPGIAAMQKAVDAPVVPVALNSGLFWGRHRFMKNPGVLVMEILPAMPSGQDRKAFMNSIQAQIDDATRRLVAEGRDKYL